MIGKAENFPGVTIAIPTHNGMSWLEKSLPKFFLQDYSGCFEVILIDSGSTDNTAQLDRDFPELQIVHISQAEFGHGKTRNLAVQLSQHPLILFTVQDAVPKDNQWLKGMVTSLLENELDAVCGGQAVPHDTDKNPMQWYRPLSNDDSVDIKTGEGYDRAIPQERLKMCSWDNVNALYRKTSIQKVPFQDVRFGEDMTWARDWLAQGGRIGYAKRFKVWHYHHQPPGFTRKRQIYTHYWRHQVFGVLPQPKETKASLALRWLKGIVVHAGIKNPMRILHWMRYNKMVLDEAARATDDFLAAAAAGTQAMNILYDSLGASSPMATKTNNG